MKYKPQYEWRAKQPREKLKKISRRYYLKRRLRDYCNPDWPRKNPWRGHARNFDDWVKEMYPRTYESKGTDRVFLSKWLRERYDVECECGHMKRYITPIVPFEQGGKYSLDNLEVICICHNNK